MGVGHRALYTAGLIKKLWASVLSCTPVFLNLKFSKLKLWKFVSQPLFLNYKMKCILYYQAEMFCADLLVHAPMIIT